MDWSRLLEICGVALGLLYLYWEYKADIRLWAVGLIMPMVNMALYYRSGLYADASMQLYYVLAGLYGWAMWWRGARRKSQEAAMATVQTAIRFTPPKRWPILLAAYAAAHVAIYYLLTHWTDSTVPFWDSLTTALSIVGMWMLAQKYVEQWLVWLAVDAITVGLYFYKGLPGMGSLYGLYTLLAIAGYLRWRRAAREAAAK